MTDTLPQHVPDVGLIEMFALGRLTPTVIILINTFSMTVDQAVSLLSEHGGDVNEVMLAILGRSGIENPNEGDEDA
jgi:hypothetical protein